MKLSLTKLIIVALVLSTTAIWYRLYHAFEAPVLYRKDFIQFYLMAKAAEAGEPIYDPLVVLANKFDPNLANYHQHPSAYPPTVLLVFRPFAKLSYIHALLLWDALEVFCFVVAATLVVWQMRSSATVERMLLVILACVLWPPFYWDLHHGQVMMTALLLLTCTWLCLASGRDKLAGLFLGLLFALKLYAWPLALFLLLRRRIQTLIWAGIVFVLLSLTVVLWLGVTTFEQYFHVAREITRIYTTHLLNFSLYALAADLAGQWFGVTAVVLVLSISLYLASRAPDFNHGFMIMVTVTIILGPVAWIHYMITLLPALCLIASWKAVAMREKVLIAILCYLAVPEIYESLLSVSKIRVIPTLFILGLMLLLSRQLNNGSRIAARKEAQIQT